jgi:hypothetical protein
MKFHIYVMPPEATPFLLLLLSSSSLSLLWYYSPLLGLDRFFSFLILYTVDRAPSTGDQPVARLLSTRRTRQTQNKRTHQTSMP